MRRDGFTLKERGGAFELLVVEKKKKKQGLDKKRPKNVEENTRSLTVH